MEQTLGWYIKRSSGDVYEPKRYSKLHRSDDGYTTLCGITPSWNATMDPTFSDEGCDKCESIRDKRNGTEHDSATKYYLPED